MNTNTRSEFKSNLTLVEHNFFIHEVFLWAKQTLFLNNICRRKVELYDFSGGNVHLTIVRNNVFYEGQVYLNNLDSGTSPDIVAIDNNVFLYNGAPINNGGDGVTVRNNIFMGGSSISNGGDSSYGFNMSANNWGLPNSDLGANYENVGSDVIFVNFTGTNNYTVGTTDLHLAVASPAINAGDPAVSYNDLNGTRNDLGMYGGVTPYYGAIRIGVPVVQLDTGITVAPLNGSATISGKAWIVQPED